MTKARETRKAFAALLESFWSRVPKVGAQVETNGWQICTHKLSSHSLSLTKRCPDAFETIATYIQAAATGLGLGVQAAVESAS